MVRTTDREGGPIHVQGENDRTLCGIPYRAEWDFAIHDDDFSVSCLRCRRILSKAAAGWIKRALAGPPRLLILACSASKAAHAAPAIELYQGPLYRILRGAWRDGAEVAVWILSAAHGLIPGDRVLQPYDRRLTASRARHLAPQVRQVLQDDVARQGPYAEAYIELGRDYQAALPAEAELRALLGCAVRYGEGAIGKRGQALKAWLRQGQDDE